METTTERPYTAPPRRYRRLPLSERFLFSLFQRLDGRHVMRLDGLPEDYCFVWFGTDQITGNLFAVLRSEEWDPVPDGEVIPMLDVSLTHLHGEAVSEVQELRARVRELEAERNRWEWAIR